jgi:hypothetical protein
MGLPLHPQLADLLAQPRELLALGRSQCAGLPLASIPTRTLDPEPERRLRQIEVTSHLREGLLVLSPGNAGVSVTLDVADWGSEQERNQEADEPGAA